MITLTFICPKCGTCCLCGVRAQDDVLSLANGLPVRLRCGACRVDNFVTGKPNQRRHRAAGRWYRFFGHCLKIAAVCRRRARETQNPGLRAFFLKRERYWLRTGWESDLAQDAAMIEAHTAVVSSPAA
jgi:hypothetical protein